MPANYPYTNFQELNLDWILQEVRKVKDFDDRITNLENNDILTDEELEALRSELDDMKAAIAPEFDENTVFTPRTYVWHDGDLYQLSIGHAAGVTWANTVKSRVYVGSELNILYARDNQIASDVDAVEDDVADLKSHLNTLVEENSGVITLPFASVPIIQGSSDSSGGVTSNTKRIRTQGKFPVSKNFVLKFTAGTKIQDFYLQKFNFDGTLAQETGYYYDGQVITFDANYYLVIVFRNHSNTVITPSDYDAVMTLTPLNTIENDQYSLIHNLQRESVLSDSNFVNLSGNLLKSSDIVADGAFINPADGVITSFAGYSYGYVKIPDYGTYIIGLASGALGTNRLKVPLFDESKNFIKWIQGTAIDNYTVQFAVDSSIPINAVYIGFSYRPASDAVPMLFKDTYPTNLAFTEPMFGSVMNKLYKKKIVCDGDSICKGSLDNPKQLHGYFGRLLRNYQMTGTDYAVGGGTICDKTNTTVDGQPRHSVAVNMDTLYSDNPTLDYLILEGGTNDADLIGNFVGDTPPTGFGTWTVGDFSGSYDATTFCGGVETAFYKAVTYYPKAKIGFIIAMEMGTTETQATRRKRYFDEIVEIAKKWHIPVLNLWEICHSDARLSVYYDSSKTATQNVEAGNFYNDGQHPTSYGYDFMQPIIESWLETL